MYPVVQTIFRVEYVRFGGLVGFFCPEPVDDRSRIHGRSLLVVDTPTPDGVAPRCTTQGTVLTRGVRLGRIGHLANTPPPASRSAITAPHTRGPALGRGHPC